MRTDEEIRDDVLEEIDWEPRITSTKIGVTVKNGAVTLLGTVGSYAEKLAAEQAARRVKGVHAIAEEIQVQYPSSHAATDEGIAERISKLFEWSVSLPHEGIRAEVKNGYVVLSGEVDWHYQREIAQDQVAHIGGVKSVNNQIKVRAPEKVQKRDISKAINGALHRNATLEGSHVKVDVDGSKVTLSGKVKAWYERKLIEDAVWATPGVSQVEDNLHFG